MTAEELKKVNEAANPAAPATPATPTNIDRINQMFDAQKEANRLQLENAFNQNMSDAQAQRDKLPEQYRQSRNDLAVQYERNRRNLNQQALSNGINTGTASQMQLSRSNEYLRDFGKLRGQETNAITEADRGIANLKAQYQNSIAAAAADNDYKRAAALLDEYNNQEARDLNKAQMLAQYGDFSMYSTLYGQDVADNMFAIWKAQNPDLAYNTGRISPDEYNRITGKWPAGYNAGGGYEYSPSPKPNGYDPDLALTQEYLRSLGYKDVAVTGLPDTATEEAAAIERTHAEKAALEAEIFNKIKGK